MILKRMDCRRRRCTTVLLGGACHRTSTQNKSGYKMKRRKKKKKHKLLVGKSLIRITVRLGSEHCIMSCLCIIVHASQLRGVESSRYLILKNIVGSTLSWPLTIKTCICSWLCYDCHCMAHASWGNSLKGNRTVSITHRSISIGPSARALSPLPISHFGTSSP